MLDKTYAPAEMEARIYAEWEASGAFRPGGRPKAKAYTIVIPPPNVTGSLHMGHALDATLQDILIRFERMRGRDVLWQPGTDHAGIATQMVVERLLMRENKTDRRAMGREAFLKRVWQWKEESGGTISRQLRRLGASCDWSRDRFTMDEGLSRAVRKVFVDLHKQGLIYKDKRLVNWDPKLLTAISDLEVVQKEVKGSLWYIRYPVVDGAPGEEIVVATTRPETMLGDTGIAVHPENPKLKHLIGRHAELPLVGRRIPIVGDDYADPEKGTGAVKITPAHDFNDFEVGKRRNLRVVNILDQFGKLSLQQPDFVEGVMFTDRLQRVLGLHGLDRFEARQIIVAKLEEFGLLEKVEPHTHQVPHGDRSDVPIEPWLTEQWYADAATLAKPAIEAVEAGETVFVPKAWDKTYFEWMRNIQPWCISRQLWWGHQIPAWYGPDRHIFVEETEEQAKAAARAHYGKDEPLTRDEDVLDTWFSSALWPFSTLGWPDATPELKRHYKTDVLVTGFDIIFFWVARMMMMGLHFMKEVPFHTVYLHGLVRDSKGQKMSKSKGNSIDPLETVDKFGADALRFTLAAMTAQGRDIKPSEQRIEGYRNFATKLWNAQRFAEMNGATRHPEFDPIAARLAVNRWIAGEAQRTAERVTTALEEFKFNEAAAAIYAFHWNVFCDWYLELVKPILLGTDEAAKSETQAMVQWTLDRILHLLHPFMPFITEELWQKTGGEGQLIVAPWPAGDGLADLMADAEMEWVIALVSEVRSVRSEMNVPAGTKIPLIAVGANSETRRRAAAWSNEIMRLARLDRIVFEDKVPAAAAQVVLGEATLALPLEGVIDFAAERARLGKELEKIAKDLSQIDGRLTNPGFVAKAPEDVLDETRERKSELEARRAKVQEALKRLGA